ncbi:hypothetical protein Lal_00020628, partial [Lupinus albus]
PEIHTFHLPCGECAVTLEDVSLQLGVSVTGRPVTGPTYFDWDEMCGELLGNVPIFEEDMRGCELKARIIYIVRGKLLPDKSNSRVHLMYLHILRDLSRVCRYKWGSACLANLYMELCRVKKPNVKAMGGCLMLLQSWIWYRIPFLAPRLDGLPTYPFAKRSNTINLSRSSTWRLDGLNGSYMRLISTISHVKSNKIRGMTSNRSSKTAIWISTRYTTSHA